MICEAGMSGQTEADEMLESEGEEMKRVELEYFAEAEVGIKPVRGGDVVTLGFGITVAVWIAAYVCRMPMVQASGFGTVMAMVGVIFAGGMAAGRYSRKGLWAGVWAGAISGCLDVLLVGAVLQDYMKTHDRTLVPAALMWVGGSVVLNVVVAGIGAGVGVFLPSGRREEIRWLRVFAMVLCAATLPLILAGGLVTAYRVGMAVPDWPQSYGYNMFLFPLSAMQSDRGNFYEHAHRLMGSLVGLTSLVMALYVSVADRRKWVIGLVWGIFLAVCLQGYIGGTRVTANSVPLAMAHGVFGQVVFGLMAAMGAITAGKYMRLRGKVGEANSTDWVLAILFLLMMVGQLVMGAMLRHLNVGLMPHIAFAVFVAMVGLGAGMRMWGFETGLPALRRSGVALMTLVGVQVLLGVLALVVRRPPGEVPTLIHALMTTLHQANGALLLAVGAVQAAWVMRAVSLGEGAVFNQEGTEGRRGL